MFPLNRHASGVYNPGMLFFGGNTGMKRCLVLLCLCWWALCGAVFGWRMEKMKEPAEPLPVSRKETAEFPRPVGDTALVALELGIYEGPFLEDGSSRPVANVAALLLKNTSDRQILRGAAVLTVGGERFIFEVFGLPAGETAFVCEARGKEYPAEDCLACDGWALEAPAERQSVRVRETEQGTLLVTNLTDHTLGDVRVQFKCYDGSSGVYLGGICYESAPISLGAGESREIVPDRYAPGYSRVVGTAYTDEPM